MPNNGNFTVNVQWTGLEALTQKLQDSIGKGVFGALNLLSAGRTYGGVNVGGYKDAAVGGLKAAGTAAAGGLAAAAGATTPGGAAGLIGAAGGPIGKIVELLSGLAPIQALLKVVSTIMTLFLMPIAIILMAILMPLLYPVLQLFAKLPWAKFMELSMAMSDKITGAIHSVGDQTKGINTDTNNKLIDIQRFNMQVHAWDVAVTADIKNTIASVGSSIVGIYTWFVSSLGPIAKDIYNGIHGAWSILSSIWSWFGGSMEGVFNDINSTIGGVWRILASIWDWFTSVLQPITQAIGNGVGAVVGAVNEVGKVLGAANPFSWSMPSLATGGLITSTGVAFLHAGERVVPASAVHGNASGGGNITVNVTGNTIAKDVDIAKLARQIAKEISDNSRKLRTW